MSGADWIVRGWPDWARETRLSGADPSEQRSWIQISNNHMMAHKNPVHIRKLKPLKVGMYSHRYNLCTTMTQGVAYFSFIVRDAMTKAT